MAETSTGRTALSVPGVDDLTPIGRGGFATVYRGWQPELHRHVAVKVLDATAMDPDAAARFRREVMAMGSLSDHPNVVPVYATGTVDDRLYLVMPLLADGSLADLLAAGPLPAAEVVVLGRGLADALAAAHGSGVLHRDVKPANVLLTSYGSAKLADFGVARFVDTTNTGQGQLLATVAYAAPEVLAGQPATEASDVYSLGATLHAACRGRPPFESGPDEVPIALAVRAMSADPPDLRDEGVPAALAAVIARAMSREPAERYATAAAFRDALDALVGVDLGPTDDGDATHTAVQPVVPPVPPTEAVPAPPVVVPATRHEVPAPEPAPVVAAAATATPTGPPRHAEPRPSRRGAVLALLALLVAIAAVGLALALAGDGDDTVATPTTAAAAAPVTEAPATTASTTVESAPTTAAPATTSADPAPPPVDGGALPTTAEEAVRSYYALMDAGRIDEGFSRLSPEYRDRTGAGSYRSFWETVAGVEVLEVQGGGDRNATAVLRYTLTDGSTSTERVTIRFVEAEGGGLFIDDYRVG